MTLRYLFTFLVSVWLLGGLAAQSTPLAEWKGEYEGTMVIGSVGRPTTTVPVTFTLRDSVPGELWVHRMVFLSEQYGAVVKDYLLRAATPGDSTNFVLDERNGVVMDQTLLNDSFYGMYTVMGMTFVTTLRRLEDGRLLWDLFGAPTASEKTTQATTGEGEEAQTFDVVGLRPTLQQTVYLRRVE